MDHRHVLPEFRGKTGLGDRLFRQTEHFVQQVADEERASVVIEMQVGQQRVIEWAEKMGFSVEPKFQDLLTEIRSHPERFVEDEVFVSPESRGQGIVKDKYTFRVGVEGRYMEDAIRLTMKKIIHPERKELRPEVRIATVADAPEIARIQQESWLATYPSEKAEIRREDIEDHLQDLPSRIDRLKDRILRKPPTTEMFVLNEGERVIGYCYVEHIRNVGRVGALYLDPAFVHRGLGNQLLQKGIDWLGNERPLELEVASYNDSAIRFYQRHGFREQGPAKSLSLRNGKLLPLTLMVRDVVEK